MTDHYTIDISPDDVRAASKTIRTLSEHTKTKGATVTGTPAEIGDQWTGAAATAIKGEMTGLGQQMTSFSTKFGTCQHALDTLADDYDAAQTTLKQLNTDWQTAQSDYTSAVGRATQAHTTATTAAQKGPGKPDADALTTADSDRTAANKKAAGDRDATVGRLDRQFQELRDTLRTQTKTASGKISGSVPMPVPPSAISAYNGTGVLPITIDHGSLGRSLTLAQQFIDTDMSSTLESQGQQAAQDLIDSKGDVSPALAAQIRAQMSNPYFAHGFAQDLDPTQLNSVLNAYQTRLTESGDYSPDEASKRSNDLLTSIGTTIGTATQGTGDLALPPSFATTWSQAMTAATWTEDGDSHVMPGQSQRLGLLMEQGTWGTDFLTQVGTDLYDYERSKDGDPVWSPKAGQTQLLGPDGKPRIDVMASLMKALGKNPEASQQFFNTGPTTDIEVDGKQVPVTERMKYLVTDRTWDSMTDATNGGNLGEALKAATTGLRDSGPAGQTSARLASQLFVVVADKTGDGSDNPGPFNDDGWQMWKGMRGSVADIVSSYSTDLLRIGRPGSNGDDLSKGSVDPEDALYLPGMPYGAAMNRGVMQKVLGTLSASDTDMDKVLAGLAVATQLRTGDAFRDALGERAGTSSPAALLKGENVPTINTAMNESAQALGWVLNAGYGARLSHEELEAKNAEMRSKMFDTFTSIPGVGPAGDWASFAFDTVTSELSDKIGETNPTATGTYNELGTDERTKLGQNVLNQMLANGYFDQKYVDEANGVPDGTRYTAPPAGAVDTSTHPPTFKFDSDAYQSWQRTKFPMDSELNTNVYQPFNQGLTDGYQLGGGS